MKEDKQATGPTLHRWQRGEGTWSKLGDPGNGKAKEISEEKGTRPLCPPQTKSTEKEPGGASMASGLSWLRSRYGPYKNSFNPSLYKHYKAWQTHTDLRSLFVVESALVKLSLAGFRTSQSGLAPGQASLGTDLPPPLWRLLFLFIFWSQKPKSVTTTGYYAVRGPLGTQGKSQAEGELSLAGGGGVTNAKHGVLS